MQPPLDADAVGSGVRSVYVDAAGKLVRALSLAAITAALGRTELGEGVLWVDIDSTAGGTPGSGLELLAQPFAFHPLAIEDAVTPGTRVKVEEYDGRYMLVILRAVRFRADTADPCDVETRNLALFIGQRFLVTVHEELSPSVDAVFDLVRRNHDYVARGSARLAHTVTDISVDEFFPILDQIDEFVSGLEERVFGRFDRSALEEIFRAKRLVLSLRRYLAPQRTSSTR